MTNCPRASVSARVARTWVATSLLMGGTQALAADDAVRDAAASCLACHQPVAHALPVLHGQSRDALVAKLRAFRDGSRQGTVMPQLAKGYSDTELAAIAGWFAAQPAAE